MEFISRYLNKNCYITTLQSVVTGTITEVKDGWILVDSKNEKNISINCDYIVKISEIPEKIKNK